jgi:predicted nucleotidyltransferase
MHRFEKLKESRERKRQERKLRADALRRNLVQKAAPIFRKYGIRRVVLFGSVAEGRCRTDSDLDLFVCPLSNELYWSFWRELEDALELPVDLHTQADDPVFVKKILERGETVYEVQPGASQG